MNTIKDFRKEQLHESYEFSNQTVRHTVGYKDYVLSKSEDDPDFFRWIFIDGEIEDFGSNLNEDQKQAFDEFVESL